MTSSTPGLPSAVFAGSGVLAALEKQCARLEALTHRVAAARSALPSAEAGVWKGPAHSLYVVALQALVTEVDAAHESLMSALRDSRRAHAAMAADA